MRHSRKKRRRPPSAKQSEVASVCAGNDNGLGEEERIISCLVEAFSLASIEEAKTAYEEANGDPNKAAEILSGLSEAIPTSCSSSTQSFGLNSSSSEGFTDSNGGQSAGFNSKSFKGNRGKKVVASTGTVSNVIGKGYVYSSPRKETGKQKVFVGTKVNGDEAEQFLCSMLGDDCELSMGVVKDVLCNCGYDVQKALEVLLDLCAPLSEQSRNDNCSSFSASSGEDPRNINSDDSFWQLTDRGSDSYSHSSGSEVQDNDQVLDMNFRNYAEALVSSNPSSKLTATRQRPQGPEVSQQVLESLFNIPKSSEREPENMNWRNVVKQMESFAQKRIEHCSSASAQPQLASLEKGAEYQVFRETARHQWDKMKTCYQKAATAYSHGEKNYASYMSDKCGATIVIEQILTNLEKECYGQPVLVKDSVWPYEARSKINSGKIYSKMAREADEKASMEIFKARNKDMENVLTIDLHGQHVKPAIRLVKLHLLFGTFISSVQYLRIITGCGSNGVGKSMLKQSVINLVKKEGIDCREENRGTLLIKLDGIPREFSFLDTGSDSDSG